MRYGLAFPLSWDARAAGEGSVDLELEADAAFVGPSIPPQDLGSSQGSKIPQFVQSPNASDWKGKVRVSARSGGSVIASSPFVPLDCRRAAP
jgi:hypothetical protein